MATQLFPTRRGLLAGGAAALVGAGLPRLASAAGHPVNMQLGWITGGNQIGEVAAKRLGYFAEEKIDFAIQPGGPNIDGVAIVASGRYEVGQVSSSPSLMLAASQGLPVVCFAVGAQQHPYAFFSLPRAPIKTPQDMIGRKIGVQATGQVLLTALLRKNGIPEDKVQKVIIGSDMTPLVTRPGRRDHRLAHQHDRAEDPRTRLPRDAALGPRRQTLCAALLHDGGLPEVEPGRARRLPARGGPRLGLCEGEPGEGGRSLGRRNIPIWCARTSWRRFRSCSASSSPSARPADGWGSFDPAVWQDQIDLFDALKQFSAGKPKAEQVFTTAILEMTDKDRPKLG